MKKIYIIIIVFVGVLLCSVLAIGIIEYESNKKFSEASGITFKEVQEAFPRISGIESVKWTFKRVSKDSFLSVGPSDYAFYGEIVLTKEYYDKIISDYTWGKQKEGYESIDFLSNIIKTKKAYYSEAYTESFYGKTPYSEYPEILLVKETKTLYFYREDL